MTWLQALSHGHHCHSPTRAPPLLSVCPKVGTSQACSTIDLAFRCHPRPSITQESLLREVPELVSHPGQMVRVEAARLGALLTASVLDQAEVARLDTRAGEAPAAPRANGSCRLTLEPLVVACLDDLVTQVRAGRKGGPGYSRHGVLAKDLFERRAWGEQRSPEQRMGAGMSSLPVTLRQCACVCGRVRSLPLSRPPRPPPPPMASTLFFAPTHTV